MKKKVGYFSTKVVPFILGVVVSTIFLGCFIVGLLSEIQKTTCF